MAEADLAGRRRSTDPADAALIVYTSGSTGSPKGALLSAEGLAENGWWLARRFDFESCRTLANLAALAVQASDADLEEAVAGAFHAIYFHGGQCCTAGSRLFVEEKIHHEKRDPIGARVMFTPIAANGA